MISITSSSKIKKLITVAFSKTKRNHYFKICNLWLKYHRRSLQTLLLGKDVPKICRKFTSMPKCDFNKIAFLWICYKFAEQLFIRTPLEGYVWYYQYKHTAFISVSSSGDGDLPCNYVCHKKCKICRVN